MLDTTYAKVTGTPGPSGWTQVYEFTPDDPEKLKLRGRLFVVISTKNRDASGPEGLRPGGEVDSLVVGREIISRLQSDYFDNLEGKPFDVFKNAIEQINIEVAACAVVDGVAYSAAGRGGRVMIKRGGSLVTILDSSADVIVASGYPEDGDSLLIATHDFISGISQGIINGALENSDAEGAAEAFGQLIHSEENSGSMGATIIKFGEKKTPLTEVVPEVTTKIAIPSFDFSKSFSSIIYKFTALIPQKNIYIQPQMEDEFVSQNKKLTFSVGLILLLVLALSIGFGVRQKGINDTKNKYQGILAQAQSDVNQAINLASASPDQARSLFLDSEQKLAQIDALKVKDSKIETLRQQIESAKASVLGEYDVTPDLFSDLTLLSSGFKGDVITSSGGSVYILDKNGKRVVSIAIDTKKSKVVAGPSVIDQANDLAAYQASVFVLGNDGIYEVDSAKTKVIDKTWSGDALIAAFAGNMYVLDKSGNEIYRYAGSNNAFGDKQNWLSASTHADFANVTDWSIDGSMYVVNPNSRILKYSLGSPQSFTISGVVPEIGNADAIYADPDNQYLYLLDRAGKRVVVVDKKGHYKAQYIGDGVQNATNLIVSEANKKIILLTGDKLLSIDLKN